MRKTNIVTLIIAIFIPLVIGGISAALSAKGMVEYGNMNKPPLSPPPWVFSVAWTILYIMMGIASYFIAVTEWDTRGKMTAMIFYAIQLAMNFMWSIVFFNWGMYLVAFIWLMVMWLIVIICAFKFYSISKTAAFLMIPYIIWLTFAAYLNLGSYILNMKGK